MGPIEMAPNFGGHMGLMGQLFTTLFADNSSFPISYVQ